MSKLFISYRRADSLDTTGRIYDRLASNFGEENIFRDIDSISGGEDFREIISDSVTACKVILAIIGKEWVDARDDKNQKRLNSPNDFVRIELETGMEKNVPIIPVLVNHAKMPVQQELPDSLKNLVYRHAVLVRPDPDFNADVTRLIKEIRKTLPPDVSVWKKIGHIYKSKYTYLLTLVLLLSASITVFVTYTTPTPPEPVLIKTDFFGKWKGNIKSLVLTYDIELTASEKSISFVEKSPFSNCVYHLNETGNDNGVVMFTAKLGTESDATCIDNMKVTLRKLNGSSIEYRSQDPNGPISQSGTLKKVE